MAHVKKTQTYSVPIDKFYRVITDYESYPDFMDGVDEVKIIRRDDHEVLVEYSISIFKEFTYRIKLSQKPPGDISWVLDSGDLFKKNDGSWELVDIGSGKTQITYTINAEFKLMIPKMVINKIIKNNLPKLFENLYERAKGLQ